MDWAQFWDGKAQADSDFQATGRGLMTVPGYLHTVAEIVRLLDLQQGEVLADIGCGAGLVSMSLAPWLRKIYAIDFSPALVARARGNLDGVENVSLQVGNLTALALPPTACDKALVYSVLQYLPGEAAVARGLAEIERILRPGGRALLAANPDPARRREYEKVVESRPDKENARKEMALLDSLLWLPGERLVELAGQAGLEARIEPISEKIWQHFYMFDLVVEKKR